MMVLKLSTLAHFTKKNSKKSSGSYLRLKSEINLSMKFKITSIKENPHDGVEIEYPSTLHRAKLKKSCGCYLRLRNDINLSMKFNITRIKENPYDGVEIEYLSTLHRAKLKKIFWMLPEAKKRN